jgi:hypothetical protein
MIGSGRIGCDSVIRKVEANRPAPTPAHPRTQSSPLKRLSSAHGFYRRYLAFELRIFWRMRSRRTRFGRELKAKDVDMINENRDIG